MRTAPLRAFSLEAITIDLAVYSYKMAGEADDLDLHHEYNRNALCDSATAALHIRIAQLIQERHPSQRQRRKSSLQMAVMTATMMLRIRWLHRPLASGASSKVTAKMISGHGFNLL
jgi:hypothetical protein